MDLNDQNTTQKNGLYAFCYNKAICCHRHEIMTRGEKGCQFSHTDFGRTKCCKLPSISPHGNRRWVSSNVKNKRLSSVNNMQKQDFRIPGNFKIKFIYQNISKAHYDLQKVRSSSFGSDTCNNDRNYSSFPVLLHYKENLTVNSTYCSVNEGGIFKIRGSVITWWKFLFFFFQMIL